MSDLVQRLRGSSPSIPAMRDGADEIERLKAELAALRARLEGRQTLPAGWKIEVRDNGSNQGLCVLGPKDVGAFAVDKDTNHVSEIRDVIICALGIAICDDVPNDWAIR